MIDPLINPLIDWSVQVKERWGTTR